MNMMRSIPRQLHMLVVVVMLVMAAYQMVGMVLATCSLAW